MAHLRSLNSEYMPHRLCFSHHNSPLREWRAFLYEAAIAYAALLRLWLLHSHTPSHHNKHQNEYEISRVSRQG